MSKRKTVNPQTLEEVLLLCRRRCCICYGLHGDLSLKRGQVAHLDGVNSNNNADNLAYLCLDHHDEYDGRTSQSKGLTAAEVRHFRKELHEIIDQNWRQQVCIQPVSTDPASRAAGHYVLETQCESSELEVQYIDSGRVRIRGFALWGTHRDCGPNIGELDFEANYVDGHVIFEDVAEYAPKDYDNVYRLKLRFGEHKLWAEEDYVVGYFGMNVSFAGEYVKVGHGTT